MDSFDIVITNVNDAPVIGDLDGETVAASNNGAPVLLDAAPLTSVSDIDSADFDGGTLTVTGNSFSASDSLGLDASGNVSLSTGFANGSVVSVAGTDVGTLSAVSGSGATITLNASATPARVAEVVSALTFATTSTALGDRTVDVVLVDGDGTAGGGADTSNPATVTVSVTVPTPGGVGANVGLWLRADAGVTGSPVTQWADQSAGRNDFTAVAGQAPLLNPSFANFNPSLTFDGVDDQLTQAVAENYTTGDVYFVFDQTGTDGIVGNDTDSLASVLISDGNVSLRGEQWRDTERLGVTVFNAGSLGAPGDYTSATVAPNEVLSFARFSVTAGGPVFTIESQIDGNRSISTANTTGASNRYIPSATIGAFGGGRVNRRDGRDRSLRHEPRRPPAPAGRELHRSEVRHHAGRDNGLSEFDRRQRLQPRRYVRQRDRWHRQRRRRGPSISASREARTPPPY